MMSLLELRPPTPRAYAKFMKSNDGAIFLSQLFYWQAKAKRSDGYFYKSVREWCEELCLTEYQVENFRTFLHGKGILQLKKLRAEGHPTIHYRINQQRFNEVLQDFLDTEYQFPSDRTDPKNDEVLDAEILESADAAEAADVSIADTPLQWLVDEIRTCDLSEIERGIERRAYGILLSKIDSGSLNESDLISKAERLRNHGLRVTAEHVLRFGI